MLIDATDKRLPAVANIQIPSNPQSFFMLYSEGGS